MYSEGTPSHFEISLNKTFIEKSVLVTHTIGVCVSTGDTFLLSKNFFLLTHGFPDGEQRTCPNAPSGNADKLWNFVQPWGKMPFTHYYSSSPYAVPLLL